MYINTYFDINYTFFCYKIDMIFDIAENIRVLLESNQSIYKNAVSRFHILPTTFFFKSYTFYILCTKLFVSNKDKEYEEHFFSDLVAFFKASLSASRKNMREIMHLLFFRIFKIRFMHETHKQTYTHTCTYM